MLLLMVRFWKVKRDSFANQLITFTRRFYETLPIQQGDLLSAALDQTRTFELFGGVRDRWPLDAEHFCQKVLSDRQRVIVTAVTHHQ